MFDRVISIAAGDVLLVSATRVARLSFASMSTAQVHEVVGGKACAAERSMMCDV